MDECDEPLSVKKGRCANARVANAPRVPGTAGGADSNRSGRIEDS